MTKKQTVKKLQSALDSYYKYLSILGELYKSDNQEILDLLDKHIDGHIDNINDIYDEFSCVVFKYLDGIK